MREPPPAAITTAWNSICHTETASLTHGSTGPSRGYTGSLQPGPIVPLSAARKRARPPLLSRRRTAPARPRRYLRSAGAQHLSDRTTMAAPARSAHESGEPSASMSESGGRAPIGSITSQPGGRVSKRSTEGRSAGSPSRGLPFGCGEAQRLRAAWRGTAQ